jgi:rhamnogalacturonyl hydrolase YesR
LTTHCGLLLLYEATGKAEYLERPQRRWDQAVQGGFVWPTGGVGEKFRVSYPVDEGCSEADWLRLNLQLWRLTSESRYLEMAERLLGEEKGDILLSS